MIATKSMSHIPLRTSLQRKEGLVRSYAIRNGEGLRRSPKPPNPNPRNVVAVLVLLVRNGTAHIARFDLSPVSNTMPYAELVWHLATLRLSSKFCHRWRAFPQSIQGDGL